MSIDKLILKHFGEKTYNYYQNTIGFGEYIKKNPKDEEVLKQNKQLHNKYKGRRCFILGNGPSLKDVNFDLLTDEYVFTVNNIMKVDGYKKLNSNFHLWVDPAFFGLRKDLKYDMNNVKKDTIEMLQNNETIFFALIDGKPFMDRIIKNSKVNINYFKVGLEFDEDFTDDFDFTKFIPSYTTVVQYAIALAIYMGFSEIYLLGCDSTNIKSIIDQSLNIRVDHYHAYSSERDDTEKHFQQIKKTWNMDKILYDQYLLFRGYRYLYKYCTRKRIKLVNLTNSTLIDVIPQKSIDEVFHSK